MKYLKFIYDEDIDSLPIVHYMEIDDERYEVRAVSEFVNGVLGYADETKDVNNAFLSEVSMPTIEEFYESGAYDTSACDLIEIEKNEFEEMWEKAKKYCECHDVKTYFAVAKEKDKSI